MEKVYKNIVASKTLGVKDKAKRLVYYLSRRRGAERSWASRHQELFLRHHSYYQACDFEVEDDHRQRWSVFRKDVDMSTLRISRSLFGEADARIVPEDIFVSDIEPALRSDESCHFLSHKSFYNRWFPGGIFPADIFHCIEGRYMDAQWNEMSLERLAEDARHITFPVVMKPNKDSFGGKDVRFVKDPAELISLCSESNNFVVQQMIQQHDFFRKYNPVGLNTIRVYVYRSVADNKDHIINMALRMGKAGSLDNETSGGIHTRIRQDGSLNGYAVDKYGEKFIRHPDTGYAFDEPIPDFEQLKKVSLEIAQKIFFTRIIGLDVCYDNTGRWRAIEINTKGHTIRFAQYGGQPFFGKFTDEVIAYCRDNHWALSVNL